MADQYPQIQPNRLRVTVSYQYDADGLRVAKNDDGIVTNYLVDRNRDYGQVIKELDSANNPSVSYLYGDDLISQTRAANDSYYLYDGLGSTRALSDSAGIVTDTYDYSSYGQLIASSGATESSYRYTGEQYDGNLNNYYLRARYYDQSVGRFTQQDTWMGRPNEPITLNKYLYANANPAMYTDPTGNFSIGSLGAGMNGFAILATTAVAANAFSMMGKSHVDTWNGSLTTGNVTSSLTGMIILASMVSADSPLLKMIQAKGESSDKSRKYVAREAELVGGDVKVGSRQLRMGEAILEVRAGADVMAYSQELAREIALLAGGGRQPIGPEKHTPKGNKWPIPYKGAYRWHYHTADRNGAHIFF